MAETQTVFTPEQVEALLAKQKADLRENAVNTLMEKNAELKNDLALSGQDTFYNIGTWEVMSRMARDMVQSGALPKGDNAFTVMMKMQAGREMGLKPVESIKAFYIVNGVLNIFGDAVIRRLREHGWRLLPYEEKQDTCTATIQKGDEKYSETFTFDDAVKSGWTSRANPKPGWVDGINRRRKLRYGAISTLVKTYIPEVLGAAADIAEIAEDTVPLYKQSLDLPTPKVIEEKKKARAEKVAETSAQAVENLQEAEAEAKKAVGGGKSETVVVDGNSPEGRRLISDRLYPQPAPITQQKAEPLKENAVLTRPDRPLSPEEAGVVQPVTTQQKQTELLQNFEEGAS